MHQLAALVVFLLILARAALPVFSTRTDNACDDPTRRDDVDLDELAGKWYAVEILEHDNIGNESTVIDMLQTCPEFHISAKNKQADVRTVWEENAGSLNYRFKALYSSAVWISHGPQTGSLTEQAYKQFNGKVLVQYASTTQLVLSFCYVYEDDAEGFSLVLSRHRYADFMDLENAFKVLKEQGLHVRHIKRTCQQVMSVANRTTASFIILFLIVLFHVN